MENINMFEKDFLAWTFNARFFFLLKQLHRCFQVLRNKTDSAYFLLKIKKKNNSVSSEN